MEERDPIDPDWSIVPMTEEPYSLKLFDENFPKEKWEIAYDTLQMAEVVGQGAFGVVRRARICKRHLKSRNPTGPMDSKDPNECITKLHSGDSDMETVAVKMLKGWESFH